MPLQKLQVAPGIDKQNTEYGAEGRWVDSDNVRFRYGQPEKLVVGKSFKRCAPGCNACYSYMVQ